MTEYTREYYGGALMVLFGLSAIWQGSRYGIGSMRHMKAGYFPVSLGAILALIGVVIAGGAAMRPREHVQEETLQPEWRGWICIALSILAFLALGKYGGLLPATFAIVFISALGDRENSILTAFILAVAICVICVALFWWALKLQFPLFSWG
jgi:hypothetical protein